MRDLFTLKACMVSGTMSQGVSSSSSQQQQQQQQPPPQTTTAATPPPPPPQQQMQQGGSGRTDNSALIKSLLANKVTPMGVSQASSMDSMHHPHHSPHSRSVLVPSAPQQQLRPPMGTVSYVQALSQGPPGPLGPMHSPSSVGSNMGLKVVGGGPGVIGVKGGHQGQPHQMPAPPVQVKLLRLFVNKSQLSYQQ